MQSSVRSPSHWDVARHGGRCSWIDAKPQTQPHPSWPCVPLPFDGSHRSLRIPRGEVDGLLLYSMYGLAARCERDGQK